jgi:hypothetical protein
MWVGVATFKAPINLFFLLGVCLWYLCVRVKVGTQHFLTTFSLAVVCPCVFGQLLKVWTQHFLTSFAFAVVCPCVFGQLLKVGMQPFLTTFSLAVVSVPTCICVFICTVVALCKFRMHNKYVEFTTHKVFFCDEIFLSVW